MDHKNCSRGGKVIAVLLVLLTLGNFCIGLGMRLEDSETGNITTQWRPRISQPSDQGASEGLCQILSFGILFLPSN